MGYSFILMNSLQCDYMKILKWRTFKEDGCKHTDVHTPESTPGGSGVGPVRLVTQDK